MQKKKARRPQRDEQQVEHHYKEALDLCAQKAAADIQMALLGLRNRRNPLALSCYTEAYGRNAYLMAKAAERHPEYFFDSAVNTVTPDQLSALFNMAQLGEKKEKILFERWQAENLPSWVIAEEVKALKRRAPRTRREKAHLRGEVKIAREENAVVVHPNANKPELLPPAGEYEVLFYEVKERDRELEAA